MDRRIVRVLGAPKGVQYCGFSGMAYYSTRDGGKPLHFPKPCGLMACQKCGLERAQAVLDYYGEVWSGLATVYYAPVSTLDFRRARDRLQGRAERLRAEYVLTRRCGEAGIFSSHDLPGRGAPAVLAPLPVDLALIVLRTTVRVPSLRLQVTSSSWGPWALPKVPRAAQKGKEAKESEEGADNPPAKPELIPLGFRTKEALRVAEEAAWADLAPEYIGQAVDRTRPPPGIDPQVYGDLLKSILAAEPCAPQPTEEEDED